jgi:hypothetical protein|eukprot:29013-Pelagococcus_subviridis.AAC.3
MKSLQVRPDDRRALDRTSRAMLRRASSRLASSSSSTFSSSSPPASCARWTRAIGGDDLSRKTLAEPRVVARQSESQFFRDEEHAHLKTRRQRIEAAKAKAEEERRAREAALAPPPPRKPFIELSDDAIALGLTVGAALTATYAMMNS